MAATKILILRKRMSTINANVVQGRSYESFSTRKFVIRKFCNAKISRSMVIQTGMDLESILVHNELIMYL